MAIDPNRWTQKTQDAFNDAVTRAKAENNPEVTPDHLLAAMLSQEGTVVLPVLQKVGVAPLALRNKVADKLAKLPKAYGSDAQLGRAARDLLEQADGTRVELGDEYLSVEHLLLSLAES